MKVKKSNNLTFPKRIKNLKKVKNLNDLSNLDDLIFSKGALFQQGEEEIRESKVTPNNDTHKSSPKELFSIYLKEASKYELLTPEKEKELSQKIHKGFEKIVKLTLNFKDQIPEILEAKAQIENWQKRNLNFKPKKSYIKYFKNLVELCEEKYKDKPQVKKFCNEVKKYIRQIEQAKDEIVKANLKLVISIAKEYTGYGLSFADLVQEGNLGLIRAAYRFNYKVGTRFSTYASWWIRQAIMKAIYDKTKPIRFPVHFLELKSYVLKAFNELSEKLGTVPSLEEVAEYTNVPYEKVLAVFESAKDFVSLDTPVDKDEKKTLSDLIESTNSSSFEKIYQKNISDQIKKLLSVLSPREEKIIRMRFGLGENKKYTLEEIGRLFKISRERIRQIERNALAKMKKTTKKEVS